MQYAIHNCATMRVANKTGLSGQVTDDEVNLDRFHSCIRKVCALVAARCKAYLPVATMILIVTLAVPAVGQVTFNGAIQGHERGIVKEPHNRPLARSRELLAILANSQSPMTIL